MGDQGYKPHGQESMENLLASIRDAINAHSARHEAAAGEQPPEHGAGLAHGGADDLLADDMQNDHIVWEEPAAPQQGEAGAMTHASWAAHDHQAHAADGGYVHDAAAAGERQSEPRSESSFASRVEASAEQTYPAHAQQPDSGLRTAEMARDLRQKWRSATPLFPERPATGAGAASRQHAAGRQVQPATAQVIAMPERNNAAVEGSLALDTAATAPVPREKGPASSGLSDTVQQKVRSALERMDRLERAKQALGGEQALRELVSDLLEPMLKRWLEKNLADIVERRVAEEIARITGQHR